MAMKPSLFWIKISLGFGHRLYFRPDTGVFCLNSTPSLFIIPAVKPEGMFLQFGWRVGIYRKNAFDNKKTIRIRAARYNGQP